MSSMSQRRLMLWAAVPIVGIYVVAVITLVLHPMGGYDLVARVWAADRVLAGQTLYLDTVGTQFFPGSQEYFYGPPALALSALPLAFISDEAVVRLAVPLGVAMVAGSVWLSASRLRGEQIVVIAGGLAMSFATVAGVMLGAASLITMLGVCAVDHLLRTRRSDALAGVVVGSIAALRIYPVVLIVVLLLARRWVALTAALLSIGVWGLAGVAFAGVDATLQYLALVSRLGGPEDMPTTALPPILGWPLAAAVIVYAARDLPDRWGFACAGMLLAAPLAWDHYSTALLPLVAAAVRWTGSSLPGLLPVLWLPGSLVGGAPVLATTAIALVAKGYRRQAGAPVAQAST